MKRPLKKFPLVTWFVCPGEESWDFVRTEHVGSLTTALALRMADKFGAPVAERKFRGRA